MSIVAHDEELMRLALAEAQAAADAGETPVGAVIADPATGAVIARTRNSPIAECDPTLASVGWCMALRTRKAGRWSMGRSCSGSPPSTTGRR
jgi:hypothetical protein